MTVLFQFLESLLELLCSLRGLSLFLCRGIVLSFFPLLLHSLALNVAKTFIVFGRIKRQSKVLWSTKLEDCGIKIIRNWIRR